MGHRWHCCRTRMVVGVGSKRIASSFLEIIEENGWKGLWAGNTINMLRIIPTQAIELGTFKCVKRTVTSVQEKWKEDGSPKLEIGPLNLDLSFLCISPIAVGGATAGITSTIICHPLEVLKVASGGIGSGIGNYVDGNNNVNGVRKHNSVAAQSKLKSVSYGNISDNAECKLLHWSVDGVVAEGRIASTDPKVKVHHVPLGASCWKVWIDRVFVEKMDLIRPNDEMLFRPNDEMLFLEDAIGNTVAWLSKFIVLCD